MTIDGRLTKLEREAGGGDGRRHVVVFPDGWIIVGETDSDQADEPLVLRETDIVLRIAGMSFDSI